MQPSEIAQIRQKLDWIQIGSKLIVNNYGPWEILDTTISTNYEGDYVDTFWHAYDPETDEYYRLCGNDAGRKSREDVSPSARVPGWWKSDEEKNRQGGANSITQLEIVSKQQFILSNIRAEDILDSIQ